MIREIENNDRTQLVKLLNKIQQFSQEEIEVALELIDEVLKNPDQKYYSIYVFVENENILGYHCIGKRSLTDGVYDLYWIVVEPDQQNKGIGNILIKHAEDFVKENLGHWLLAETSSKSIYTKTRNFYLRNDYSIVAEINDFYSQEDSLIVFGKYLLKQRNA